MAWSLGASGLTTNPDLVGIRIGRDLESITIAEDRPSDKFLAGVRAVDLGAIEERDPELECPVDLARTGVLVASVVWFTRPRADRGNG